MHMTTDNTIEFIVLNGYRVSRDEVEINEGELSVACYWEWVKISEKGGERMQKSKHKGRERRGNLSKPIGELIRARLDRRELLKGAMMAPLVIIASGASSNRLPVLGNVADAQISPSQVFALGFESIQGSNEDAVIVPPGYESQVIIRWGDPLFPTAPAFDLNNQTAGAQSQQFGFNCDFVGYFPLPHHNIPDGRKGLLCVNHEYTRGR